MKLLYRGNCAWLLLGLLNFQSLATAQTWNTLTSLPEGYAGQSVVYYNGYLYQVGGTGNTTGPDEGFHVYYTKINTNGTIGAWQSATSLPEPVYEHAGVTANGFVYVLGGYHYDNNTGVYIANIVNYSKINSDCSLGSWQTANPLPQVLVYLSASVWNNTIYVVGGSDGNIAYSNVYSAKVQSDGSLAPWVAQASLPVTINTQAQVANGYLYVLGGIANSGSQAANTVYFSKINSDGTLAGWNQATPIPDPSNAFGAVAAGGRIYTVGGYDNSGNTLSSVYSAAVNGDGILGAWLSGSALPASLAVMAVAVNDSYIFSVGGEDLYSTAHADVYSLALPTPPGPPVLTRSNLVNGTFTLRLTATQTNLGFGLLASTNLTTWTNIGWGFTDTNGKLTLTDTNAASFPNRFYRAYWPLP